MSRGGHLRRVIPRTEERLLPVSRGAGDGLLAEHWARYRFIAPHLSGRLLDLGCGTGYGARELARVPAVTEIVGVDRSSEALASAVCYYPDPKVSYRAIDLHARGWESDLGRFDGIVALEILEHLEHEGPFWSGIRRALNDGGVLWLSTPLGRGRGRPAADPFHVHQLRRSEVARLFAGDWERAIFGQVAAWIEPWVAGRRYYTILVRGRSRRREQRR